MVIYHLSCFFSLDQYALSQMCAFLESVFAIFYNFVIFGMIKCGPLKKTMLSLLVQSNLFWLKPWFCKNICCRSGSTNQQGKHQTEHSKAVISTVCSWHCCAKLSKKKSQGIFKICLLMFCTYPQSCICNFV